MSFRNIVGSDPSPDLLREVVAQAGTDDLAPALTAASSGPPPSPDIDRMASAFLNHRILTHLLRQFGIAGLDLGTISVAETIWGSCSTSTVVPAVRSGPGGRVPLDQIRERLDHHREIQRRVITTLTQSVPRSFLVMFGLGISLAHREYSERFSHDIDLVVASADAGHEIVRLLNSLGFDTTEARSGSYRDVPFHDWTLDAPDIDGHRMHMDLSTGAITRSDGWMKPVVLADLFDAAQAVPLPRSPGTSVLVPNDTHQLLLLAEKAQRTQRYDHRVRCDANVLVRFGTLDIGLVDEVARRSALLNTLRWALGPEREWSGKEHRDMRDRVNSILISAMARNTHRPARFHRPAAKAFRRICV